MDIVQKQNEVYIKGLNLNNIYETKTKAAKYELILQCLVLLMPNDKASNIKINHRTITSKGVNQYVITLGSTREICTLIQAYNKLKDLSFTSFHLSTTKRILLIPDYINLALTDALDLAFKNIKYGATLCSRKLLLEPEIETKNLFYYNNLLNAKINLLIESLHIHQIPTINNMDILENLDSQIENQKNLILLESRKYTPVANFKKYNPNRLKIKTKKESKISLQPPRQKCDHALIKKLSQMPDYGPLITAVIFEGCILDNLAVIQLQYAWISMERELSTQLSLNKNKNIIEKLVEVYTKLQSNWKYTYSYYSTNFLSNYYFQNRCNCMCGTVLLFKMSLMIKPPPKIKFICCLLPEHIVLVAGDKKSQIEIETTRTINHYNKTRLEQYYAGFISERIFAYYIILGTYRDVMFRANNLKQLSQPILDFYSFFGLKELWIKTGKFYRLFETVDTSEFTEMIDLMGLFWIYTFSDSTSMIMMKKYFQKDYADFFAGKKYTQRDLKQRKKEVIEQFKNKLTST